MAPKDFLEAYSYSDNGQKVGSFHGDAMSDDRWEVIKHIEGLRTHFDERMDPLIKGIAEHESRLQTLEQTYARHSTRIGELYTKKADKDSFAQRDDDINKRWLEKNWRIVFFFVVLVFTGVITIDFHALAQALGHWFLGN